MLNGGQAEAAALLLGGVVSFEIFTICPEDMPGPSSRMETSYGKIVAATGRDKTFPLLLSKASRAFCITFMKASEA